MLKDLFKIVLYIYLFFIIVGLLIYGLGLISDFIANIIIQHNLFNLAYIPFESLSIMIMIGISPIYVLTVIIPIIIYLENIKD